MPYQRSDQNLVRNKNLLPRISFHYKLFHSCIGIAELVCKQARSASVRG